MSAENVSTESQLEGRLAEANLLETLASALHDLHSISVPDDVIRVVLDSLHRITEATAVTFNQASRFVRIPTAHANGTSTGSKMSSPISGTVPEARIHVHLAAGHSLDPDVEIAVNLLTSALGQALARVEQEPKTYRLSTTAATNELSEMLFSLTGPDDVRQCGTRWIGSRLNADHCLIVTSDPDPAIFDNVQARTHVWSRSSATEPLAHADIIDLRSMTENQHLIHIPIASTPEVELIIYRTEGRHPWTAYDRETAHDFSNIIGQHLARTQKRRDAALLSHNLQAVQQIASAAPAAASLTDLYSMLHIAVKELIPHDTFQIALRPPGNDIVTMVYRSEGDALFPQRIAIPTVVHALEVAHPMVIDDILDGTIPDENRFGDQDKRVRSVVSAPLMSEGKSIGLIIVQSYEQRYYSWDTAQLLRSIAMSVVGTFERLMLLEQIELQTSRDVGLRRVAERLGDTLDHEELIAIASGMIFDTVQSNLVMVLVVDRQTNEIRMGSYRSTNPDFEAPPAHHVMRNPSLTFAAIESGEQVVEQDYIHSNYANPNNVPWHYSGSAVATPIPIDAQMTGVIVLARDESDAILPDDLSLMRQIAAMLSTALQNTIAHAERLRHTNDLIELNRLSSTVAAQLDLQKSLDAIVQATPRLLDADSCVVGMLDGTDMLRVAAHGSLALSIPERVPLAELTVEELMHSTEPVVMPDVRVSATGGQTASSSIPDTTGWLAMSLLDADDEFVGVICMMTHEPRVWTDRERSLLATLANAGALAIQNARHFERTRDLLTASVESLATAVEAKDPYTQNHSRQVAIYARRIAEALNLDSEMVGHIELAGLLHDVGKIGIPDSVLEKPGPLDGAGWAAMQLHPVIGEQILAGNPILNPLLAIVRHHHERWDGHEYPDGLRANDIPLGASIISLAEALDTMTSHRPYRTASDWETSLAEIQASSGSQFAPHAVGALMQLVESGAFDEDIRRLIPDVPGDTASHPARNQPLDMRTLRIFDEVAHEIRAGSDLATFISRIVRTLDNILEISFVALFLVDGESGELVLMEMLSNMSTPIQPNKRIPIGRGIVGWVAEHGVAQNIADVHDDPRFIEAAVSRPTRSELTVPLIAEGNVIGVLNLESDRAGAFSEMDAHLLESTAGHLANAIHVISLHERLKKLAVTDALTGLDNHRALFDQLVHEVDDAADNDAIVSIAILDVNNLKAVNDTYGHLTGDAALRAVADVLARHQREGDVISRYGGDEFALILPGASSDDAWTILASISAELRTGEFDTDDATFPLPTASWGIATFPVDGRRPTELLRVADERMYQQKQATRL